MKYKTCLPILAAAAALAGAVFRGLNLIYGYEAGTCLPRRGDRFEILLIALTVLAAAGMAALASGFRAARSLRFEAVFASRGGLFKMLSVAAGLVLILAGAAGLYVTAGVPSASPLSNLPMFALWLLAILSGGCLIGVAAALSREGFTESSAMLTIIPMFWACFDLIITFKDNSASPFVGLYGFELLAAIALTYAFYTLAGFLYSVPRPARFAFSAGMAFGLCVTCVGGAAISLLSGSGAVTFSTETLLRYACFLAAGVWLFALLVLLTRNAGTGASDETHTS